MRPAPIADDYYDSHHNPIPEDDKAESWYEKQVAEYELMQRMMGGRSFGPSRPK